MGNSETRDQKMNNLTFQPTETGNNESFENASSLPENNDSSCRNNDNLQIDATLPDCPPCGSMSPRILENKTDSEIHDEPSKLGSTRNLPEIKESSTGDSLCSSVLGDLPTASCDINNAVEWTGNESAEVLEREADKYMLQFGIHNTFIYADIPNDRQLRPSRTEPAPYLSQLNKFIDKNATATNSSTTRSSQNQNLINELTPEYLALIPLDENGNLTSIGSTDHAQGTCRPCAFIHNPKKKGCENGINCAFCHYFHVKKKKPPRPSKQQRQLKKLAKATAVKSIEETKSNVSKTTNNNTIQKNVESQHIPDIYTFNEKLNKNVQNFNTGGFDFAERHTEPVITTKLSTYYQQFDNQNHFPKFQGGADNMGKSLLSMLQKSSLEKNYRAHSQQTGDAVWGAEMSRNPSPILCILSEAGRKACPNHNIISEQYMSCTNNFSDFRQP